MPTLPEYDDLDATALAELVAKGAVSPVELVEAAIERIEARDPGLNAVVHRMYDRARAQAADPELPRGPFRGVPFLLKDLRAEDAGEPSTGGSRALVGWIAADDAPLVRRFKRAGLVVCGRTNAAEFGIAGVTESALHGPVRNPWDAALTPGGSSGGSAAAVAARMVPAAHGGDGGGSLRIPASACGLVGLKPTRGRVPPPPAHAGWGGLVVEHVLTRSVRDTAGLLDCTRGPAAGDACTAPPPARPYREELDVAPGRLRIAFTLDSLSLEEDAHADCVEAVTRTARLCEELGHEVVESGPRIHKRDLSRVFLGFVAASTAATIRHVGVLRGRRVRAREVETETWLLRTIGETLRAADLIEMRGMLDRESRNVARFFETCDVLLTPTLNRPPARTGDWGAAGRAERLAYLITRVARWRPVLRSALHRLAERPVAPYANTELFNLTGQPAISLPLHWNDDGVPIGVQFAARFGDEATLLRLARQLEEARPWADRRPPAGA